LTLLLLPMLLSAQPANFYRPSDRIYLDSKDGHDGAFEWKMLKAGDSKAHAEEISMPGYGTDDWLAAIVPGTVLNSLVYDKIYPEPYYGDNNRLSKGLIPDLAKAGRDFYTYWFRTEFEIPKDYAGRIIWLQIDGINYRAEIWVNGHLLDNMAGMFKPDCIDITDFAKVGGTNALAIKVYPVDMPGTVMPKQWGAGDELHNGGDGNIGLNTTMLMSAGWDFTFMDGVRDRNTGIWRSVSLYSTGTAVLRHPFVKSELSKPGYDVAKEYISVDVLNPTEKTVNCEVRGEIVGEGISFSKKVSMLRGEQKVVDFTPEEFTGLVIKNPRLWWPINKGSQELYELKLTSYVDGKISDVSRTKFGIREITSDRNTPDSSRQFYVNGKKLFVRGTNWIPEAMLRTSDERMYAELRYTQQAGNNMIRMWGGGIAESDYFFQLCDEMGFLVWQEFFMTGDTKHPHDKDLYFANVEATVKRLRCHPSLAYYVCSNESSEMSGIRDLIFRLDGTRGYQMQSECDGIHDGSPYKIVNPMRYYENTASDRGSRIDGFNPEYGTAIIPTIEPLREMMDEKDLWPINKEVWNYMEGDGFYMMTTLFKDLADQYGECSSLEDFVNKGQLVGATSYKAIWEVWNYNKFSFGDRYTSGVLFWYLNSPLRQVDGRMWDYTLEPTAALFATQNALEPLHPQFDYLKNTVSVCNDYYKAFSGCRVKAEVYDINSRKVCEKSQVIDIPEDGVANDIFRIEFPENISQVHFIKLRLFDYSGKLVGDNFYWRSKDEYKGKDTITGPCVSGFESLEGMPSAKVRTSRRIYEQDGRQFCEIKVRNTSSKIAFFIHVQYLDGNSKPVRPSFYTDNFFSLLPGESKTVSIETAKKNIPAGGKFILSGWNVKRTDIR
jgi:mannosylglycoprotein endo-beta-mannosidase